MGVGSDSLPGPTITVADVVESSCTRGLVGGVGGRRLAMRVPLAGVVPTPLVAEAVTVYEPLGSPLMAHDVAGGVIVHVEADVVDVACTVKNEAGPVVGLVAGVTLTVTCPGPTVNPPNDGAPGPSNRNSRLGLGPEVPT